MILHITNGNKMPKYAILIANVVNRRMVLYQNHPDAPTLGKDIDDFMQIVKKSCNMSMFII